jgi:peptidyl-prolyl cis-trans isomerase D
MFDFVRQHSRMMFFIMVLLIIPSFVFFGMDGYTNMRDESNAKVAEVAGRKITQGEWDAAHRQQSQRLMQQMPNVDAKLLDTPEMKNRVLEDLVRDRLLTVAANKMHLETSDARLQRIFSSDPQFASIRNADGTVNKDLLAMQGMSSEMFAQSLRSDLSKQQVTAGVSNSVPRTLAAAAVALDAFYQQREIQFMSFDVASFLEQVKPSDADLEAYYRNPRHAAQFQTAELADVEYLVLDLDTLMKTASVSADDMQKFYKDNASRYSTMEEKRARHILLKLDASASKEEAEKVRARAQALLDQLRKDPGGFAELAKKNSDDPGSAANGGDLDFFGRGAMVKPFEDAAFKLKPGQISDLVRSDFGFHIIEVTASRGGEAKPFEAVKAEIEDELRRQAARRQYTEWASEFTNMVYEQADSLQPAAEKFKLEIRKASNVSRTPLPGAQGPLANAKFLEALFSKDSIASKRNTDAIESGASQLVSGRLVNYRPARTLPLADVREQVRQRVAQEQAAIAARKAGESKLAALRADPAAALESVPVLVSRIQAKELAPQVVDAVLGAAPDKLPQWVGVEVPGRAFVVAKVIKVTGRDPLVGDDPRGPAQYAQAWGDAESKAYYAALKSRFKVKLSAAQVPAPAAAASQAD